MIGNAIRCDECGKVDVIETSMLRPIKWFSVRAPQQPKNNDAHYVSDICSLDCLKQYAEGWTASA